MILVQMKAYFDLKNGQTYKYSELFPRKPK